MTLGTLNLTAFQDWVSGLLKAHKVFGVQAKTDLSGESAAAEKTDKFHFAELTQAEDLRLDYDVTLLPPKHFFQPSCETLLEFSAPSEFKSVVEGGKSEKFILLGVHPYDMTAINQMDKIFSSDNPGSADSPSRSAMAERGASADYTDEDP